MYICGCVWCSFYLHMWVALRQYTNVCLRPIYIDNVVVKELKLKINFDFVDKCGHALWGLNLHLIGYNLAYGQRR